MRILAAIISVLAVAGCGERSACPGGTTAMAQAELLFGRNRMGAPEVTDAEWQAFVTAEITPRFPSGITVVDAAGQWRGQNGATVREDSKIVTILAPDGDDTRARLNAIAAAYKVRFHQESVGIVIEPACASF